MSEEKKSSGGLEILKPTPPAKPPVPDAISLFDDDDERTEIAPLGHLDESKPAPPVKALSLDDDDEDRTVIDKKPFG